MFNKEKVNNIFVAKNGGIRHSLYAVALFGSAYDFRPHRFQVQQLTPELPLYLFKRFCNQKAGKHLKDIRQEMVEKVKAENLSFLDGVRLGTFTVPGDGCIDFEPIFKVLESGSFLYRKHPILPHS